MIDMKLHRLIYYPGLVESARMNLDEIEKDVLKPFLRLFDNGWGFNSAVPDKKSKVVAKWTGSPDGQALLTCLLDGLPFLSSVLVTGLEPQGDLQILQMFVDSLDRIQVIQEFKSSLKGEWCHHLNNCSSNPSAPYSPLWSGRRSRLKNTGK